MASGDSYGAAREFMQNYGEQLLAELPKAIYGDGPELSDEELHGVLSEALDDEVEVDLVEDVASHVRVWPLLRADGKLRVYVVADSLNDRAWLVHAPGGSITTRPLGKAPNTGEWSVALRESVRNALAELRVRAGAPLEVSKGFEWLRASDGDA